MGLGCPFVENDPLPGFRYLAHNDINDELIIIIEPKLLLPFNLNSHFAIGLYKPLFLRAYNIQVKIEIRMDQEDFDYGDYNNEYEEHGEEEENIEAPSYEHPSYSNDQPIHEQQNFQILPLFKIFNELNTFLQEVQNLVYLSKGWCLILLKEFKWDKEYLKEEYYNNSEGYLKKIGFKPSFENPLDFDKGVKGICEVCCFDSIPIYYNICGHNFCLECWISHLKHSILNQSAFPRCMDCDCECPVLFQTINGMLRLYGQQGQFILNKLEKKICESFITTNRSYQFCTGVDCGNCIKINVQVDTVKCNCGKVFCFRCQSDDHYPCKCQQKTKWIQKVVNEQADAKWISQNAKICPWCKKAVQRSMGCNFMACKCGKSFCYMCSQPWQPDHKDHFKCHIYKKKPDEEVNRQKEVMMRLNHCTERYIFNQAVANNYKEIDVFSKRKYLFKVLHIDLTDSEFMENAYKFAIQCCEKLKWIYAFTYFHDLNVRKEAFEFSLGQYEKYKENLLKLLAADLRRFIEKVEEQEKQGTLDKHEQFIDEFKGLKKQIVNYYTCTKNFKEKFVQELQMVTEQMDAEKQKAEMISYCEKNPTFVPKKSKSIEKKGKQEKGLMKAIFGGKNKNK